MKLRQRDIILLHLADHLGAYTYEWKLRGKSTPYGFIGDEAKKRCREFFEPEATTAEVKLGNSTYYLERGEKEGFAIIRCVKVVKPVYQLAQ